LLSRYFDQGCDRSECWYAVVITIVGAIVKKFLASVVLILILDHPARAAELRLLSTGMFRGVLPILLPAFERSSAHTVSPTIATPAAIREMLIKGDLFDVLLLPTNLSIQEIAGAISPASRKEIARAMIGVAARPDVPPLDLSTPQAVRNVVVAATSVALTDPAVGGISGFVQSAADKFGFGPELKSRTRPISGGGTNVADAVAKGHADIGITLASEIVVVQGVKVAGLLPGEMQLAVIGYGVVGKATKAPEASMALIEFLASQESRNVMSLKGLYPP
jgi:molybdate transport system substrate-binding protein